MTFPAGTTFVLMMIQALILVAMAVTVTRPRIFIRFLAAASLIALLSGSLQVAGMIGTYSTTVAYANLFAGCMLSVFTIFFWGRLRRQNQ
jgi:hypothetical protein